jgi:hypothetical protein
MSSFRLARRACSIRGRRSRNADRVGGRCSPDHEHVSRSAIGGTCVGRFLIEFLIGSAAAVKLRDRQDLFVQRHGSDHCDY